MMVARKLAAISSALLTATVKQEAIRQVISGLMAVFIYIKRIGIFVKKHMQGNPWLCI